MNYLFLNCPKTGFKLDTGIETSATALADNWDMKLRLHCSHCGEVHVALVRDVYTAYALSSDRLHGRAS